MSSRCQTLYPPIMGGKGRVRILRNGGTSTGQSIEKSGFPRIDTAYQARFDERFKFQNDFFSPPQASLMKMMGSLIEAGFKPGVGRARPLPPLRSTRDLDFLKIHQYISLFIPQQSSHRNKDGLIFTFGSGFKLSLTELSRARLPSLFSLKND